MGWRNFTFSSLLAAVVGITLSASFVQPCPPLSFGVKHRLLSNDTKFNHSTMYKGSMFAESAESIESDINSLSQSTRLLGPSNFFSVSRGNAWETLAQYPKIFTFAQFCWNSVSSLCDFCRLVRQSRYWARRHALFIFHVEMVIVSALLFTLCGSALSLYYHCWDWKGCRCFVARTRLDPKDDCRACFRDCKHFDSSIRTQQWHSACRYAWVSTTMHGTTASVVYICQTKLSILCCSIHCTGILEHSSWNKRIEIGFSRWSMAHCICCRSLDWKCSKETCGPLYWQSSGSDHVVVHVQVCRRYSNGVREFIQETGDWYCEWTLRDYCFAAGGILKRVRHGHPIRKKWGSEVQAVGDEATV